MVFELYDGKTYLIKTLKQLIADGATHTDWYVSFNGHTLRDGMTAMLGEVIQIKYDQDTGNHSMYLLSTGELVAHTGDIRGFLEGFAVKQITPHCNFSFGIFE